MFIANRKLSAERKEMACRARLICKRTQRKVVSENRVRRWAPFCLRRGESEDKY